MGFVRGHPSIVMALLALPFLGLGIVLLYRPEDLLRWTSTGKAWGIYRTGRAIRSVFDADLSARLAAVRGFYLAYDMRDAPAAQRLRSELQKAGGVETTSDAAGSTMVLLLTNYTPMDWLSSQAKERQGRLLTVVGTGIKLPDSLRWIWRRQWIDFRRWDSRRTDRGQGLPQVPEALTRLRVPAPVKRTHHVLCAMAALIFVVAGSLVPDTSPRSETLTSNEALQMLGFFVSLCWAVPGSRLIRRTLNEEKFFRYLSVLSIATFVIGCWDIYILTTIKHSVLRTIPAVIFLIAAPLWLMRQRSHLAFWFRLTGTPLDRRKPELALGRNWRTLLWCVLYAMLWMLILNLQS